MTDPDMTAIEALRRFNRFHTRWVGALGADLHGSGVGLTEARVLYELAQREDWRASALAAELGVDPAYLSRLLKRFAAQGWIARRPSRSDGRAYLLSLTPEGRAAFATLEAASRRQAGTIVQRLDPAARQGLVAALRTVEQSLSGAGDPPAVAIRPHGPGDMGWVIAAHARLYAREYGFDDSFEALVAEIAAGFLRDFRPGRERAFIADMDGAPVGCAFVVQADEATAKLRLVLVERRAQGLGLGKRLVAEAVAFARAAGYRRMVLWTNDILHAARAIYRAEGFVLTAQEPHHSFGCDLVGETWELDLAAAPAATAPR